MEGGCAISLEGKLIINAAITGMVPTKRDNPHVPISPEEIAADARRCRDAGASIVHLHARDEQGRAHYSTEIYGDILRRVREACPDIVLCVSTSGRVFKRFAERSAVLDIEQRRPEMASLTLGSMNFAREESVNTPTMIKQLATHMRARGVCPELEVFDLGMAEYSNYLVKQGVLQPPYYCNILLGSLGTLSAGAMNLAMMVRALPERTVWAGAGIGRFQFEVNCLAIAMGGHVRVGLEDNVWFDAERTVHATNAGLIARSAAVGRSMGREVATPEEARRMIGLPQQGVVEVYVRRVESAT